MDELVKRISSYHIFNFLVPGTVFAYLFNTFVYSDLSIIQNDLFLAFFVYYFIGSIISRVGSVFLSKWIDKIFKIKKVQYSEYISAESKDSKIDILSEINNMYRTFFSLFFILSALSIIPLIHNYNIKSLIISCVFFGLFLLYVFSYKKQTNFIVKRVQAINAC